MASITARPGGGRRGGSVAKRGAAGRARSAAGAVSEAATDAAQYFQGDRRPIVLFDGVCNLCNGGVNFILDWDTAGELRFAALQSDCGKALLQRCGRAPTDISSIVLVEEDGFWLKSDAIARIAQRCAMPLPALGTLVLFFPSLFRDTAYDVVAANRYLVFGRTDQCRLDGAGAFAERFVQ